MAEIKSTLDLVMEKLKDMEVTEEEKRQFREKEEREKAQRLFHRYFKGEGRDWDTLKREVRKLEGVAREEFLRLVAEEIPLDGALPDRYARGLEVVFGPQGKGRIEEALEGYRRRREARGSELKAELLQDLARRGIKGSAVDPNPRFHPRWREVMGELERDLRKELHRLLEEIPIS